MNEIQFGEVVDRYHYINVVPMWLADLDPTLPIQSLSFIHYVTLPLLFFFLLRPFPMVKAETVLKSLLHARVPHSRSHSSLSQEITRSLTQSSVATSVPLRKPNWRSAASQNGH